MRNLYKRVPLVAVLACGGGGGGAEPDAGPDCVEMAAQMPAQVPTHLPVEDLDVVTRWAGFAFHHTHVHNEGVGKWYLYTEDSAVAVRAPVDGRICRFDARGTPEAVGELELYRDSGFRLRIGGNRAIQYAHMDVLAGIDAELSAAGPDGIEVKAGDLLGMTATGPYAAVDFQLHDFSWDNGLPASDNLAEMRYTRCPMDLYEGSALQQDLIGRWQELTWSPAVAARMAAAEAATRAPTENAELASDTCSHYNVDSDNEGTIFGSWYDAEGPGANWFHYNRGTIGLVPNAQLSSQTYTVGFGGEVGLWSEMLDQDRNQQAPWVDGAYATGIRLATGSSSDDAAGCFALAAPDGDLWVAWAFVAASNGNDSLSLTRVGTDEGSCLAAGVGSPAEARFVRYP